MKRSKTKRKKHWWPRYCYSNFFNILFSININLFITNNFAYLTIVIVITINLIIQTVIIILVIIPARAVIILVTAKILATITMMRIIPIIPIITTVFTYYLPPSYVYMYLLRLSKTSYDFRQSFVLCMTKKLSFSKLIFFWVFSFFFLFRSFIN